MSDDKKNDGSIDPKIKISKGSYLSDGSVGAVTLPSGAVLTRGNPVTAELIKREIFNQQKIHEKEIKSLTASFEAREKSIISRHDIERKDFARRESILEERMSDQSKRFERQEREIAIRRDELLMLERSNVERRKELDAEFLEFEAERVRYTEESQNRLKTISTEYVNTIVEQLDIREAKN